MKLILPNLAPGWTTSTRRTRLALTFALCIPGAVHLLAAELYESGRAWQWTLMSLLLRIFILHPLLEYWGHWLIHEVSNVQHANHHSEIKHNSAGADEFEFWCYLMAVAAYHSSYTRGACIGFLSVAANSNPTTIGIVSQTHECPPARRSQYAWFHQLSHDWPALVPHAARHHAIHHIAPSKNLSISLSWPDRVFGTNLPQLPRAAPVPVRVEPMLEGRSPPCYATERRRKSFKGA